MSTPLPAEAEILCPEILTTIYGFEWGTLRLDIRYPGQTDYDLYERLLQEKPEGDLNARGILSPLTPVDNTVAEALCVGAMVHVLDAARKHRFYAEIPKITTTTRKPRMQLLGKGELIQDAVTRTLSILGGSVENQSRSETDDTISADFALPEI